MEQPGQLGWLITNRSQVQILPPQPRKQSHLGGAFFLVMRLVEAATCQVVGENCRGGSSQGNLPMKTCFQSWSLGVAECDQILPPQPRKMDYPSWVVHFPLRCRGRIWFCDRARFTWRMVVGSRSRERKLVLARVPFGVEESFSPIILPKCSKKLAFARTSKRKRQLVADNPAPAHQKCVWYLITSVKRLSFGYLCEIVLWRRAFISRWIL